jgi:hypothetical protein
MSRKRMRSNWTWTIASAFLACGMAADDASAQSPGGKPFEDIYRRPAVSPYNQISNFSDNPQAAGQIYQQMVLPLQQQEQQRIEQMTQRRQVGRLQGQVQQIQRDTSSRQIDETIRPTGHASTYMNYSHYYQQRR